ncbi:MAG TPA: proline racemase family protein [Vicinamibacterales bacterium]
MIALKTIDAHVGGEPLRLIVEGFPAPRGKSLADKRDWAKRHADHLRRLLMLEPRGHRDMSGAVLTEPASPGSHAGVLFMNSDGFSFMCGHAVIAVATIALERGIIVPGGDGASLALDTPAGTVRATATWRDGQEGQEGQEGQDRKVVRVAFLNVPSFVMHGGLEVALGSRRVRADVAFGGEFYAIVDGESVGVPLDPPHVPELRRFGIEITQAIDRALTIAHPLEPRLTGIYGTIFTGPPQGGSADLRNVTVFANGAIDRSASGTGTAAVMTVIDAMGLVDDQRPFVQESIIGTTLSGRVAGRTMVGEFPAIVPEIQGSAWITGEHTFIVDEDDPLQQGFYL